MVLRVRISRAPPLIKNIRRENVLKNSCFKNLIFFEIFDILFIESQKRLNYTMKRDIIRYNSVKTKSDVMAENKQG